MNAATGVPVAWRLPLLAAGGTSLLAGAYAGLVLATALPAPPVPVAEVHGPLLVLGFVGTLVGLERAVALRARWALLAPAASGLGALVLIATGPSLPAKLLLSTGSVVLLGVYRQLWQRQPGPALLAQATGAAAWYAATLLWLAGYSVAETVPWLATFVVATIAGERLELAHVSSRHPHAERWFLAALAALLAGTTVATLRPGPGGHLFGAGLLAVVAWLVVFDPARHTVRGAALPRYVAVGLLTGYGWLAVAGLLWVGAGSTVAGPRYDAALHAIFLGFVMSMIFAHAPVILPAVLRHPLPYHRILYAPLALLHLSLLARVLLGDGLSLRPVWQLAVSVNVVAVLGFAACAVGLCATARPPGPAAVGRRPVPGGAVTP